MVSEAILSCFCIFLIQKINFYLLRKKASTSYGNPVILAYIGVLMVRSSIYRMSTY